ENTAVHAHLAGGNHHRTATPTSSAATINLPGHPPFAYGYKQAPPVSSAATKSSASTGTMTFQRPNSPMTAFINPQSRRLVVAAAAATPGGSLDTDHQTVCMLVVSGSGYTRPTV
ncbi:unnamed protein product, partial [Sphacelaria rigidula]